MTAIAVPIARRVASRTAMRPRMPMVNSKAEISLTYSMRVRMWLALTIRYPMDTTDTAVKIQSTTLIFIQKGLLPPEYIMKVMGRAKKRKIARDTVYPRSGPATTMDSTKTDKKAPITDMM